jgi:cytidylate kinase
VAVWTISTQEGAGGSQIAAELAAAAGVPLLGRTELASIACATDPERFATSDFEEVEQRFGGRLATLALNMALAAGPGLPSALQEWELRQKLPELGRSILNEVAREPCVILSPAAFAGLTEHPSAIHVRLRAPFACRVAAYQREHLVNRECAEKHVKHDDHVKHSWVQSLYGVEIDDERRFALVLDTSRFSPDRIVEILLAAG